MPAVVDGLGWLAEKLFTLMRAFPSMTEDYILDELDGAKGWVMFAWVQLHEARVWGLGAKIVGDGYIAMEKKRIKGKGK